LLSIYPTLAELCGLPSNEQNEGKSLVPLMQGDDQSDTAVAITTFGMNNHSVKSGRYRYILYEDGGEEFYDHSTDPEEFTNEIDNVNYQEAINTLKAYLPNTNAKWDKNSKYTFQPYFVEQKARVNSVQ
jgi:arylsulfatase A-like enzyme